MPKKLAIEPTLTTLTGQEATFLSGGEFPIPVPQGNDSGTIEFKEFGVRLTFTPTVLDEGLINLQIAPEVSEIDAANSIRLHEGGILIPGLSVRRAKTSVELRDGQSFAIAGLMRSDFQTTVRQLPLLGSIPILGALFRSSNFQKGETELLIVVTPRLVAPLKPSQVRMPTDRIDDPNAAGETPLITAVHRRNIAVLRTLLKAGADPDRADNSGRSARAYALLDGRSSTLVSEIETNAKPAGQRASGRPSYGPKL